MVNKILLFLVIIMIFLTKIPIGCAASSGITLSYPLITQDPSHVHGGRLSLWLQTLESKEERVHLFIDGSVGYWWVPESYPNKSINIFSIAPLLRYEIVHHPFITPFIDISIGMAYLSRTRFADRNLGMQFAFQDELGIGALLGYTKKIALSLYGLHYSNASLGKMNAGITIPLLFNVGYRF